MIKKSLISDFKTPRFNEWKKSWSSRNPITTDFYIDESLHLEVFALLGKLLFPDFVVIKNLVIVLEYAELAEKDYSQREIRDLEKWQLSINRLTLSRYFSASFNDVDDDIYKAILETLHLSWSTALCKAFPEREFEIQTLFNEDNEPSISFCDVG